MRLMVTGGAGFIGSAVVRQAVARGHEVLNLDALTYAACLDNVASVGNAPNYSFIEADVCDFPKLETIFADFRPDAVMHLAAESHVDRSIDGPGTSIVRVCSSASIVKTFSSNSSSRPFTQQYT